MATYADLPGELTTERLQLRRWLPSDAEEYRGLLAERDARAVVRIDAQGRPTVEDIRRSIARNPLAAEPGLGLLPIERRDTGKFLGYCGLTVGQGSLEKLGFHRSDRVTEDAERGDSIWMTRVLDQA